MDVKEIRKLLAALAESDVREFSYDTGDYRLSVKRGAETVVAATPVMTSASQAAPAAAATATQAAPADAPAAAQAAPAANANYVDVLAPIVGTFYAAPAPDAAPFVKVGDRVKPGTVLCIIEAMKLMNEIEAEVTGTIREVAVSNEDPVEYGQVLFRIEPD